jgi:hypothetical protein
MGAGGDWDAIQTVWEHMIHEELGNVTWINDEPGRPPISRNTATAQVSGRG